MQLPRKHLLPEYTSRLGARLQRLTTTPDMTGETGVNSEQGLPGSEGSSAGTGDFLG